LSSAAIVCDKLFVRLRALRAFVLQLARDRSERAMTIREAVEADVPLIADLIRELADYERLLHEVRLTEEGLRDALFGERRYAEVVIAEVDGAPAGFALYFHNFSTFLGRPGIYLEDLFVRQAYRGAGIGTALLRHLARLAGERDCGRLEWAVLDWNTRAIDFYLGLGARPAAGWSVYRLEGDALDRLAAADRT
jgi:GNAT superfamily N-acetyltransferase